MSTVRESAKFISEKAQHVVVDRDQCAKVAATINERMVARNYSAATWSSHQLNPEPSTIGLTDWVFTVDLLNFSFWQDEPRFVVTYAGQSWTGYWSLVAAVQRALDEGIPITSPQFWSSDEFTPEVISRVFRSDNGVDVPLLNERFDVLKQAGRALAAHKYTTFESVLAQVGPSALKLVNWVVENIGSFNDEFVYAGRRVQLYKRAQILAADLWASGAATFNDIGEITMFADYRVPQILAVLGCIRYSESLFNRLQGRVMLPSGSAEEIEIRGCSIQAVELIVQHIRGLGSPNVNAVLVDFYLWDTAKEEEARNTQKYECHRTRSVFY